MDLMYKCQRQEQQVKDLQKLVDEIARLEQGAPDLSTNSANNAGGEGNWDTQSISSDISFVSC